jgi:hypothetical protein
MAPRSPADPPAPVGVSSLFANAKATAAKVPWANQKVESAITLACPACGAPQEMAQDFLCRYCHAPMGKLRPPPPGSPAPGASGGDFDKNRARSAGSSSGDLHMTPSQQAIVTRWRSFLGKVMGRLRDVLAEAEAGCREMVRSNPGDPMPLNNVIAALGARKKNLDKKIYDTWSNIVSDGLADEAVEHDDDDNDERAGLTELKGAVLDQADREMKQSLAWMEDAWEHFRVRWAAESVRAMWPVAEQAMQKPVACTQCGGGLAPRVRHQSDSVTCPACRAVNQVVPEMVVGMYFSSAPHVLAEEAAFQKRQAITALRRQVEAWRAAEAARTGDWPDEGVASLKQWEAMERDYWVSYAALKGRLESMTAEEQQKFVDSRMRPFIEDLERNPVWRKAHGMATA